jgi:hypothetical protein
VTYNIHIKAFICDAPARAFVKCIKGHTGYYGCEKCSQKGKYVDRKVVFPEMQAHKRSDDEFRSQVQCDHHKGTSPLLLLGVGLVSQVPLDYMHLICLGVMKRLLITWLRGEHHVRISMLHSQLISQKLIDMKPSICHEFQRKPRSLLELDRWKSVEFRQFLLYTGPVVLRDILPSKLYHHFMLLHVSITILTSHELHIRLCDYAEQLLQQFVSEVPSIYGEGSLVYNVHNLVHLADDVRLMGVLDKFSSFPFENLLGQMKRMLRSGNRPLAQLCRRLEERHVSPKIPREMHSPFAFKLSLPHCRGSTLGQTGLQFDRIEYKGMLFSTEHRLKGDCYALLQDLQPVQILNIIQASTVTLLCKVFQSKLNFFEYPCDSQTLNIYRLSKVSDKGFIEVDLKDVRCKCMILPRKNYFVLFPLLHCI